MNDKKIISFPKTQLIIIMYFLVSITSSLFINKDADISSNLILAVISLVIFDIVYFFAKRFKEIEYWQFFLYAIFTIIIQFILFAIYALIAM
ncbi:MAG: hypothetical protein Q4B52_07375 [Tissierellia bacterium]|nr:hypothetical protein [Tissierellia bacterium]